MSMQPVLSEKEMLDVEHHLLVDFMTSPSLTLLVNTINGIQVEAIFTSKSLANQYMIRIAVNFAKALFVETGNEERDFYSFAKEQMHRDFKLIEVTHIDSLSPIYMLQTFNYRVHGQPVDFLTNSLDVWKKEYEHDDTLSLDEWSETCIVTVDPPLPPLETA